MNDNQIFLFFQKKAVAMALMFLLLMITQPPENLYRANRKNWFEQPFFKNNGLNIVSHILDEMGTRHNYDIASFHFKPLI